jgi:GH18 family chitinase
MKAAIIGSRSFNNYDLVLETLLEYENTITLIVSGGAKGADTLGERWAKEKNKEVLIFYPEWDKYGKSAGFRRNKDIIENSDIVFAFWDGVSKGTKSSIDLSNKLNKELKIIKWI